MRNESYTKKTEWKIFGKTIFVKEEICSGIEVEGQIFQINMTPDYYNSEFEINKENKNNEHKSDS
ncbi:MAG: hypothetical protein II453_09980 [Alphaproteobacteria bacterium]|nr:hypothetical protein [Alphaproteobacteria bacterium]MBQ3946351.1 hypothetical protein [Alphaproteobacteria bacterium]